MCALEWKRAAVLGHWAQYLTRLLALMLVPALSFCISVGPDYTAPQPTLPDAWSAALRNPAQSESDPAVMAAWWEQFEDPTLTLLVRTAAQRNASLKEALARVQEARARRGLAAAEQFPRVDASGQASSSATTRKAPQVSSSSTTQDPVTAYVIQEATRDRSKYSTERLYQGGLDARWELDLFGKTARSIEAADADLGAAREAHRDTLISLLAETALAYVELRSFESRLEIARQNLSAQEETLQLVRWRVEAGLIGGLDEEQARLNVETTRSRLPPLEQGQQRARHRVAILMGYAPGALPAELMQALGPGKIPVPPPTVAVGIPADLLRRRPDIRQAERELAAETARVGVATADLYPQFFLPGSITYQQLTPGTSGWTGSLGIGFNWNVFDRGAIRRNIDIAGARLDQKMYRYDTVVLAALEETESALVTYAGEENHRQALERAVAGAAGVARLTEQQYAAGLTDFFAVLQAQQNLLNLQDQLTQSAGETAASFIRLYKALGGGWTVAAPEAEDPS